MTGSSAREREKGPGKWTEEGRDVQALLAGLSEGPTRELELTERPTAVHPRALAWAATLVLAAVVAATAWYFFR